MAPEQRLGRIGGTSCFGASKTPELCTVWFGRKLGYVEGVFEAAG